MKYIGKMLTLAVITIAFRSLAQEAQKSGDDQNFEEAWICSENVMSDTIFQRKFESEEECHNYCNGVCEKTSQPKGYVQDDTAMADFWYEQDEFQQASE